MNYKSPIQVNVIDEMVETIQKEQEIAIMEKVKMFIDVDKKELLKALQYDRNQYIKGYADGYNKVKAELERRRPTGCWVGIDEEPHEEWECTNCGNIIFTYLPWEIEEYKYCHQCGAIMSSPFIEGGQE